MRVFVLSALFMLFFLGVLAQNSPEGDFFTYHNSDLDISFDYPETWGKVEVDDFRDVHNKLYPGQARGMDWRFRFQTPRSIQCGLTLRIMFCDADINTRVIAYEGSQRSIDLLEERKAIQSHPDRMVGVFQARVHNYYFEPGAQAYRVTTWFSDTLYFELMESACIYDYPRSKAVGFSKFLELHPENTSLKEFDKYVSQLLASFKTGE